MCSLHDCFTSLYIYDTIIPIKALLHWQCCLHNIAENIAPVNTQMAGPLPKERDVLIFNYANLTSTVRDVDHLLPYFVAAKIINNDDTEEIGAVHRTSERVAKLLKYISGIG